MRNWNSNFLSETLVFILAWDQLELCFRSYGYHLFRHCEDAGLRVGVRSIRQKYRQIVDDRMNKAKRSAK